MSTYEVEAKGLVKDFGEVVAVKGIDFTVAEGEFFSLLGPSGCGKTTTLRCIAGLERPTEGTIAIGGRDMTNVPPYERNAGLVFQGYALFPHKTVGENIGFGLKMQGVGAEERETRVAEILDLVNLPGFEDRQPSELSGGQQQRVALARALVIEPSVLLLDEPLSNLDLKLRKQMRFELQRIQDELGITTVYVTHDQEEALSMSDQILVMNQGRVEQQGSPIEIYNEPANEFVADFIGETNLFSGTIDRRQNGTYELWLNGVDHGRPFAVSTDATAAGLGGGDAVNINLRPEDLSLDHDVVDADNVFSGTITAQTFLGKDTRLLVSLDGDSEDELLVETSGQRGQQQFDTGDEVDVGWDPADCLLIPEES
jgi:spermidine/putrescine transport system ATP-binding protein